MFKKLIISILVCNLFAISAFATSRTDNIISDDTSQELDKIATLKENIKLGMVELNKLENDLNVALKNNSAHEIFIKTRNIAGITTLVALATLGVDIVGMLIVAGTADKYNFESFALFSSIASGVVAPAAAAITVIAGVGVKLTRSEADEIRNSIKCLKALTANRTLELQKLIKILCKQDPRHPLCY